MSPATDTLSMTFAALSDPTRRAMLARLVQGEASVNALAEPFNMSLPAVSKHIKVLEKAGLLTKTRQAQQRPRWNFTPHHAIVRRQGIPPNWLLPAFSMWIQGSE